jgi:hypothetical protein
MYGWYEEIPSLLQRRPCDDNPQATAVTHGQTRLVYLHKELAGLAMRRIPEAARARQQKAKSDL